MPALLVSSQSNLTDIFLLCRYYWDVRLCLHHKTNSLCISKLEIDSMSDFMKNLRGLFVTESTNEGEATGKTENSDTSSDKIPEEEKSVPKSTDSMSTSYSTETTSGKISPKFTKILLEAIEKHNMQGFDYLEFKNSVRSLSKMDMDEATKFKSAFAMAQTMGAKSSALLDSAKHYLNILVQEKKKFDSAAAQQMSSKIELKKKEIAQNEKAIASKEAQIKKLESEISALRSKVGKADSSLKSEEAKVRKTQSDFVASYNNLYNQIQADIEKMTNYLK